VWLIHTQKASDLELDALMDGINLYLPKIEVKRWPKSRLVFGGKTLLNKSSNFKFIITLLFFAWMGSCQCFVEMLPS